jgi:aspartate/methionine/tyrosine aminotransferase
VEGITPFMVMEVLERARGLERQGRRIIHLEVGEPDFETPGVICSAMKGALDGGCFGYTHSLGDPVLREALSRHYRRRYGLSIEPGRFLVCPGTSAGLTLLFGALLEPGDKVLMSDPHYACYPNFVRLFSGEPAFVEVLERDGFRLDPGRLEGALGRRSPVKAVLINSPANPTGAVLDSGRLRGIASLGAFIVSDEIYHGLSYGRDRDRSILEFTDNAVVAGGCSKAFAMTGWRVGWLVLPPSLVRPMQAFSQNFMISVNAAAQRAAACALDHAWPEVEGMRLAYGRRRRRLIEGLKGIGLGIMSDPEGAFYVLANARGVSGDSMSLAFELLEGAGVGVAPGKDFGEAAEGFLRFSYAASMEDMDEGVMWVGYYLKGWGGRGQGL